jgi:nucleoside-diphosphate-sugar epimerase
MSEPDPSRIVLFGATGKVGQSLARRFAQLGYSMVLIGRRREVLAHLPGETLVLDLLKAEPGDSPIRPGDVVINAAHARYTRAIVRLCPSTISRLVVLGSTRHLTRFADEAAEQVRDAAHFLQHQDLPWVLLHPTMIYGAQGENNVHRIAGLIKRFSVIPLPGGGKSLIQPIHVDDVVEAVVRALGAPQALGQAIPIAGPQAVSYADFVRAIACAIGRRVWIVALPYPVMGALAWMTTIVPGVPSIKNTELQRLLEDKSVETQSMADVLGLTPRPLDEGLQQTFTAP